MWIEFKAVLVAIFASILFGYIYEICSRKCVLITCFVFLCIGMVLPFLDRFKQEKDVIVWSRIIVCVLVQAILQNPLLNDYVKRRNRGWASGFQRLGYTIGEIVSFIFISLELHKDEEMQDKVFFWMTGIVFFLGIFVVVFMVKDRKIPRTYTKDDKGVKRRHPEKLQKDDDENDTGSDIDIGLPDGAYMTKAKNKNVCGQIKLIWGQKKLAVKEDSLNWLIFYCTFVNKMCRDKFMMIVMIWYASFIVPGEDSDFNKKESEEQYKYVSTLALTASLFAVPMYGWLTDRLSTEYELGLAYITRCAAGIAFFSIHDPMSDLVTWAIVGFVLSSNFEEVCIESLYSKRLPGDIRAAMLSL